MSERVIQVSNKSAFGILYAEYYRRVFGLCRRLLGSAELAEDAAQETFMRAYRSFHKFDPAEPFWHWIAAIASNHCIDVMRRRSRDNAPFGDEQAELDLPDESQVPALAALEAVEAADVLNAAIASLPDKYRVPLVLAYYREASYDEIAAQLGITRTHVGVLLLRAKERLRVAVTATQQESHA
jgi:RNA polymerase sigma-70 factor, ECF subfamily